MGDSIIGLTAAGRSYEQPATAAAMAMHRESLAKPIGDSVPRR
jgi:hypothetical protein